MTIQIHNFTAILLVFFSVVIAVEANSSAVEIVNKQCTSCHSLSSQAPQTIQGLRNRKGQELASAGVKYKQAWLVKWLQKPGTIRPSGMLYSNHIKPGKKLDEIDKASLVKHPILSKEEAEQVAELLMTKTEKLSLVTKGEYKEGSISMTMGEMIFDKFKGCLACHQIEPGYGGLSGPEMYTAANRFQEDYLISFMRNPQVWEPKSIMPNKHLKDRDLQKMVHYLRGLSKENFK